MRVAGNNRSLWLEGLLIVAILLGAQAGTLRAAPSTDSSSDEEVTAETITAKDVQVISRVKTRDNVVFITIDDGFTPTPALAKILRSQKVPITTFAMPRLLKDDLAWFKQQKRMTFENHTINHSSLTFFGISRQRYEICGANNQIQRLMGDRPQLFRPPGGNWNGRTIKALAKCNIKYLVMWSGIAEKGRLYIPDGKLQRGDIILMHYIPSAAPTLELLLAQMKRQGLKPALLRDYLK